MPQPIQDASLSDRLRRFFRLRGRTTFSLDETVVPMVLVEDLSTGRYPKKLILVQGLGLADGITVDPAGAPAQVAITVGTVDQNSAAGVGTADAAVYKSLANSRFTVDHIVIALSQAMQKVMALTDGIELDLMASSKLELTIATGAPDTSRPMVYRDSWDLPPSRKRVAVVMNGWNEIGTTSMQGTLVYRSLITGGAGEVAVFAGAPLGLVIGRDEALSIGPSLDTAVFGTAGISFAVGVLGRWEADAGE